MKFVISLIRNIIPEALPNYLGRWKIEYCKMKINNKIDLANEDHCGCCAIVATVSVHNKVNVDEKEDEYLVPYVSEFSFR